MSLNVPQDLGARSPTFLSCLFHVFSFIFHFLEHVQHIEIVGFYRNCNIPWRQLAARKPGCTEVMLREFSQEKDI